MSGNTPSLYNWASVPADLAKAIADTLRTPDCGHDHASWPQADVLAIVAGIQRAGYLIVPDSGRNQP